MYQITRQFRKRAWWLPIAQKQENLRPGGKSGTEVNIWMQRKVHNQYKNWSNHKIMRAICVNYPYDYDFAGLINHNTSTIIDARHFYPLTRTRFVTFYFKVNTYIL